MSNLCHTDGSSIETESVANSRNNPCRTRTDSEVEEKEEKEKEVDLCRICQMEGHFANVCPNEELIRKITKHRTDIAELQKQLKTTHIHAKERK